MKLSQAEPFLVPPYQAMPCQAAPSLAWAAAWLVLTR
jgi:hypothetical protein